MSVTTVFKCPRCGAIALHEDTDLSTNTVFFECYDCGYYEGTESEGDEEQ